MESVVKYIASGDEGRLWQGEIVANLIQVRLTPETVRAESPRGSPIVHPFAIVLSQDCDLEQHYRHMTQKPQAKPTLPNVLFCEAVLALTLRGAAGGSDVWKRVRQNKDERYHCLEGIPAGEDSTNEGIGALGIDFKRYFTIPTDEIYERLRIREAQRRARLTDPYAFHLARRFFYYQSRVALPGNHVIELTTSA